MLAIIVQRDRAQPVALGATGFFDRFTTACGMIAAGATIAMIPIVAIYLVLQRRFIKGMTARALKS